METEVEVELILKIIVGAVDLEEVVEAEVVTNKKASLSLQETEVEALGVHLVEVQEFLDTAAVERTSTLKEVEVVMKEENNNLETIKDVVEADILLEVVILIMSADLSKHTMMALIMRPVEEIFTEAENLEV